MCVCMYVYGNMHVCSVYEYVCMFADARMYLRTCHTHTYKHTHKSTAAESEGVRTQHSVLHTCISMFCHHVLEYACPTHYDTHTCKAYA